MPILMSGGSQVIDCIKCDCTGYLVINAENPNEVFCSKCGIIHPGPVRIGGRLL